MNSLTELNSYSATTVEFTDQRPAEVLFNTRIFVDKEIAITSTAVVVTPTYDITEIVNWSTANCRYRITILSNNPAFVAASNIQWASLPSGISSSGAGGVYTLTGLKTRAHWEAVKNPTWNLPANYATYTSFWIRVSVVYFDQATNTTVDRTIDIYDRDFYPVSQLESRATLSCDPSFIFRPSTALTAQAFLFAEGEVFFATKLRAEATLACSALGRKGILAAITSTATISCEPTEILAQLIARGPVAVSAFISNTYDQIDYEYVNNVTPTKATLQMANSRIRWSKNTDLVAVGRRFDGGVSYTISFYKKQATTLNFDSVYTIEAFDFIPTPRDQYTITDFKFREDGGAIILGGNPRAACEIWTIVGSTFTRQAVDFANPLVKGKRFVALHPNGLWAAQTAVLNSDFTNNLSFLYKYTPNWSSRNVTFVPTSSNITSADVTFDISWDPTGEYFAVCVGSQTRIFHFNSSTATATFLRTVLHTNSAKLSWSPSGTYLIMYISDRIYLHKRAGSGTSTTWDAIATVVGFPSPNTQFVIADVDWKFDESVVTLATDVGLYTITRSGDTFTYQGQSNVTDNTSTIAWRKQ